MASPPDQPESSFTWRAHPARERWGRALVGAAIIVALATLVAALMQSLWWGILALAVLLAALNRFFFPSRFTIDGQGITACYPLRKQRLSWSELRRFAVDNDGGFLSTRATRTWLDAYRGMHILFGEQRDRVVTRIRGHVPDGGREWAH